MNTNVSFVASTIYELDSDQMMFAQVLLHAFFFLPRPNLGQTSL